MLAWVRFVLWACFPVLMGGVFLPFSVLPLVWVATSIGVRVPGYALAVILVRARSPVAMWYAGSMAVALGASLYEDVPRRSASRA